ncbi:hypothetical protein FB561_0046 [Kribbella amoyensis]|uniref:Uncharacterized protein n=1 Tax=Kribbella amoyensis TaxID=996641 RepID=A0A561BJE0_9ACTN|nr:hypothetical protein [Kribbella amoyensis]TWD78998.1 hypothetical protein FB561_0046 [Kribbella amoyensis]
MPGFGASVRRWIAGLRLVDWRALWAAAWPSGTAAAVVAGCLWVAVPSGGRGVAVPAEALYGSTLQQVRPSVSGDVDPRLGSAVDAILARRGQAVKTNDLGLFLRDVAPELRVDQRLLFQNMRKLGMSATYRRAEVWTNYEAMRKYGLATGTFRVSMRYQLLGTRLAPAATDVGYTYTVRDGRLFLVDDDDLDLAIGAGRQPWDYGPIDVVRRSNVLVVVDQGQLPLAGRLADQTVAMARQVRQLWRGPLQLVPMVVALREPGVLTNLPPTLPGDEPARIQALPSPAETGRPVGGWIVVPPTRQRGFDAAQTTHALVHLLPVRLGEEAPRWLAEGLARYAENKQLVAAGRGAEVAARRELARQESLGELIRLPADDEFASPASGEISWLAVENLIGKAGLGSVTDFYLQVARRGYNDFARERLLKEYTGLTEPALVESLRSQAE